VLRKGAFLERLDMLMVPVKIWMPKNITALIAALLTT
jgi:hypothetical protein